MDLMSSLPSFYEKNEDMKKLQSILSEDVESVISNLDKTINQCFVNSADELLSRFEKLYGIETDITKDLKTRREAIKSKMAGTGTFTKQMAKRTIGTFQGGFCDIIEDFNNYRFTVLFNGPSVPDPNSIPNIYRILEELKPAHLDFDHDFMYKWWDLESVKSKTWGSAGTWNTLRMYK